jgi:signal transduction histidine kinase
MNEAAAKLTARVFRYQASTTLVLAALLAFAIPHLLLVDPAVEAQSTIGLLQSLVAAGFTAVVFTWVRLRRYQYLLRALALGSRSIEPYEMAAIGDEPGKIARGWLAPHLVALGFLASPLRPPNLDWTTGLSAAVLAGVVVAAATLPLHAVIRGAFLRAVELAPVEVMREVAEAAEQRGRAQQRIPRRLMTAVATPVAFVALGSALIVNAHLRRADEYSREETARALARAALELGPGLVAGAGSDDAIESDSDLGFSAIVFDGSAQYSLRRTEAGITVLRTPLDVGSAEIEFSGSTVPVLSGTALFLTLSAVLLAAVLGFGLGRTHSEDLLAATAGIRLLGTEAVIRGRKLVLRPPRFRVVGELERAIERLAERFRVFARAQERAIDARKAATRMRGLFFASVSHDLKSPLNAILGFAELVRMEPLTSGQAESLSVIDRRGRELLALIETILDAARVEAGQLSLILEPVRTGDLVGEAMAKAKELSNDSKVEIVGEVGEGVGQLLVDRIRLGRALATLIAFGVRQAERDVVRVRALVIDERHVRIDVEVPSRKVTFRRLQKLLSASQPRIREDRGLALGLSLSRSVIELHSGSVRPVGRTAEMAAFSVTLPKMP